MTSFDREMCGVNATSRPSSTKFYHPMLLSFREERMACDSYTTCSRLKVRWGRLAGWHGTQQEMENSFPVSLFCFLGKFAEKDWINQWTFWVWCSNCWPLSFTVFFCGSWETLCSPLDHTFNSEFLKIIGDLFFFNIKINHRLIIKDLRGLINEHKDDDGDGDDHPHFVHQLK